MVARELPPVESPDVQEIRLKMDSRLVEKNLPIHIYEARTLFDTKQPYEHLKAASMLGEGALFRTELKEGLREEHALFSNESKSLSLSVEFDERELLDTINDMEYAHTNVRLAAFLRLKRKYFTALDEYKDIFYRLGKELARRLYQSKFSSTMTRLFCMRLERSQHSNQDAGKHLLPAALACRMSTLRSRSSSLPTSLTSTRGRRNSLRVLRQQERKSGGIGPRSSLSLNLSLLNSSLRRRHIECVRNPDRAFASKLCCRQICCTVTHICI